MPFNCYLYIKYFYSTNKGKKKVPTINLNEIDELEELEELESEEKISKVKKTKMKPEDVRYRNKKQKKGRHKTRRNRKTAEAESKK